MLVGSSHLHFNVSMQIWFIVYVPSEYPKKEFICEIQFRLKISLDHFIDSWYP